MRRREKLLAQLGDGDLAAWLGDTRFAARDLRFDLQQHSPRFVVRRLLAGPDAPRAVRVVVPDVPANELAVFLPLDDFAHGRCLHVGAAAPCRSPWEIPQ
ncbi:hypothetical protein BVG81_009780 [Haliangium sp. UPWRP_2]|nr:hypothetical protein BVG81_009780 [Haliangium sp. UPWRP_2]